MFAWISDHPNGNLVPDFKLQQDEIMVILNTIVCELSWSMKFDKQMTKESIFHKNATENVNAEFMDSQYMPHYFVKNDIYSASSRTFEDSYAMHFVLPNEGKTPMDILADSDLLKH